MSFHRLPLVVGAAGLLVMLAGCSPSSMMAVSPNGAVDLMKGVGSVSRSPDGDTTFRYVIPIQAYSSYSADKAQAQREWLISSWVGSQGICPDGYTVNDEVEKTSGMLVYTGTCK